MDIQQVFDTVATHLLRQGKKAIDPSKAPVRVIESGESGGEEVVSYRCMYRAPDGSKCAAGCLLADEDYHPGMEDKIMFDPLIEPYMARAVAGGSGTIHDKLALVRDLQVVHDRTEPERWPARLAELAQRHGLSAFAVTTSLRFL